MMKKLLIAASVAAAVTASTSTFANGLTLSGDGAESNINVVCNGHPAWLPIPANGSLPTLSWSTIAGMFLDKTTAPIPCTFTLAGNSVIVGTAYLSISGDNGIVTNPQEMHGYSAKIDTSNPANTKVTLCGPTKTADCR